MILNGQFYAVTCDITALSVDGWNLSYVQCAICMHTVQLSINSNYVSFLFVWNLFL